MLKSILVAVAAVLTIPAWAAEVAKPDTPQIKEVTLTYNEAFQLSQALGNLMCAKSQPSPQGLQCIEQGTWAVSVKTRIAIARDLREINLAIADAKQVMQDVTKKYADATGKPIETQRPEMLKEQASVGELQVTLSLETIDTADIAGSGTAGPSPAILEAVAPILSDFGDLPVPRRAPKN